MPIQIKGLDALYRKLGAAAATSTLVPAMQRSVLRVQRRMQEYPPPPPARQGPTLAGASKKSIASFRQPYKRTGTYGRRWTTKVTPGGNGVEGRTGNNTAYAPFVGSEQFQARVHRDRWNTDAKIIKDEEPAILADFQGAIDKALGG